MVIRWQTSVSRFKRSHSQCWQRITEQHFIPFPSSIPVIAVPRSPARDGSRSNRVSLFPSRKALSIRDGVSTRLMYHGFLDLRTPSAAQRRGSRSLSLGATSLESGCQAKSSKSLPQRRARRQDQKRENSERVICNP